jgi:enoyl-CoA hydratase
MSARFNVLPGLIGDGLALELAFAGVSSTAAKLHAMKLVNQVFVDKVGLMNHVMGLASQIASKSPLTVRGIKDTLNFSRDHSVAEGLAYVAAKKFGDTVTVRSE